MGPEAPYLAEIKATERSILRQHCLQRASNELQPGALTRLYMQLPAIGGRELCRLAPEYRYMTAPARRRAAQKPPLQNPEDFGENLHLVTPEVPASDKTLYVFFGGQDGQFFIPFATLLALLPDGPKDIVAIRSGVKLHYMGGVAGLGQNAHQVAATLRARFHTDDYDRVVIMGISVGGIFSLRIADCLAADVGVSFAFIFPDEGYWLKDAADAGASAFDPICACRPQRAGRMINVLASKNEFDVLFSMRFKKARPALRELHLVNSLQHNVLQSMLSAGFARVFMRMALARNGGVIWLVAMLSKTYGQFFVRGIRRALGRQIKQNWYLQNRLNKPPKAR